MIDWILNWKSDLCSILAPIFPVDSTIWLNSAAPAAAVPILAPILPVDYEVQLIFPDPGISPFQSSLRW